MVFSLDPMAVVGAAQITSFMQAMFWSDVVLLSNKSCSMDAMQPDSRVALLSATTAAGVSGCTVLCDIEIREENE